MELYVVGCHGGETPKHRVNTFILDRTLAIDAGSVTRGLEHAYQREVEEEFARLRGFSLEVFQLDDLFAF